MLQLAYAFSFAEVSFRADCGLPGMMQLKNIFPLKKPLHKHGAAALGVYL